jgi:tripeptidyl-peptidase-1
MTRSSAGDWISLSIPVGRLEKMLGAKYHVYKHSATETTLIRTSNYSLPSILHDHVTVVTPSTYFNLPKPLKSTSFVQSSAVLDGGADSVTNDDPITDDPIVSPTCDSKITPSCLNMLYNISYIPVSTGTNSLGIVGYLDEFANHADLKVRNTVGYRVLSPQLIPAQSHSFRSSGRTR